MATATSFQAESRSDHGITALPSLGSACSFPNGAECHSSDTTEMNYRRPQSTPFRVNPCSIGGGKGCSPRNRWPWRGQYAETFSTRSSRLCRPSCGSLWLAKICQDPVLQIFRQVYGITCPKVSLQEVTDCQRPPSFPSLLATPVGRRRSRKFCSNTSR